MRWQQHMSRLQEHLIQAQQHMMYRHQEETATLLVSFSGRQPAWPLKAIPPDMCAGFVSSFQSLTRLKLSDGLPLHVHGSQPSRAEQCNLPQIDPLQQLHCMVSVGLHHISRTESGIAADPAGPALPGLVLTLCAVLTPPCNTHCRFRGFSTHHCCVCCTGCTDGCPCPPKVQRPTAQHAPH